MQLPQWKTTIYRAKWCKMFFLPVHIDGDLTRTLFVLFTNDLSSSVPSGSVYMYGMQMIQPYAVDQLNKALQEFYNCRCLNNQLTPHPRKSKVILLSKRMPMGPIAPVYLGSSGHQDKTVRSDSRPEIHLGGQHAGNKEKFCQKT